jgi:TolB-like protein/Flp pilus assembly protein TadD
MPDKVFISHSSKDKEIADAICQHLESAGVPCWIAPRDIEPGADWTEGILRGIANSRLLVLVFSSRANDSEHVPREVGRAFSLHLPVIPFRVEPVEPRASLGYFLDSVHWLDATEPPLERHLPVLTERVKTLLNGESQRSPLAATPPEQTKTRRNVAAPRRIARLSAIGLTVAAAIIAAGVWFFTANNRKTNEANLFPTATAISPKSIAVLPFESLSGDKEDSYFADGVQDEILNDVAKIAQLTVISRTSVMQYRASEKRDLRQIANALGVANVLEGTVRRSANRVRVSTELVDARQDKTIWADSFDRDLTDIFAIQSEIAQKVASTLSARLSSDERKEIEEKPTDNLVAYDLYLEAKQLLQTNYYVLPSREKETYSNVISLLEKAIQQDGKFALAYCLLTKVHDILYYDRIDHTPERRALGDEAVNEALLLRPDLPEAHLAMAAHLYYCYRDFERALIQIQIAERALSNSSAVLNLAALVDRVQGRWENSIAALERAVTLDPRNPELLGNLTDTYIPLRRFLDAQLIVDRVIELKADNPEFLFLKMWLRFAEKGDVDAALAACEALPSSVKDDPWMVPATVGFALYARDFAAAKEILSQDKDKEILFCRAYVPKEIFTLWLEFLQGNHPTMVDYGAAREELYRKVEADPTDPFLMVALAQADLALGRKEKATQEAGRATELRPISEDAYDGPVVAMWAAQVYALANQLDAAFAQLNILVKIPSGLNYGELKTNPSWDPLRKDPRYEKLSAELAPRE